METELQLKIRRWLKVHAYKYESFYELTDACVDAFPEIEDPTGCYPMEVLEMADEIVNTVNYNC